jgi:hypothetical protein
MNTDKHGKKSSTEAQRAQRRVLKAFQQAGTMVLL